MTSAPPSSSAPHPQVSLIASVTPSGGIGQGNALLWHEPEDQKHFRRTTMGHPVVMGRRTWDSLPARFRPLPGRSNIVLTRHPGWQAEGALPAPSLQEALAQAAIISPGGKVFVIGGAEVYALALPHAHELVLTEIGLDMPADAFFPPWSRDDFELVDAQAHLSAAGVPFRFATYRRKALGAALRLSSR
jgi:dihydrofolate reductase